MFTIYSADVTGNPGNCSYPHKHVVLDEASLKAAVCHDYACAEYQNSYRNGDNFIGSDCLPVDCDNDHSENPEDWITPEDVLQQFPGVTFAVHFSRFNMREKNGKAARPKFHVLFPIDYVTDPTLYSDMKKLVNSIFPYFDTNALDAARFFFGTTAAEVALYPGRMNLTDFLEEDDFDTELPDGGFGQSTVIPEGSRNATMSRFAGRVIKKYGDTDEAYQAFLDEAAKCVPPLENSELNTIWHSAQRFFSRIREQAGYVPPEAYNDPSSYKPEDYSDVGQAEVMARYFSGELRYSPATHFIRYSDHYWQESEPGAQAVAHELTRRQMKEANRDLMNALVKMKNNGAQTILDGTSKAKAEQLMSDEQLQAFQEFLQAKAYQTFVIKRRDSKYITSALKESHPMLEISPRDLDADCFALNTPEATYDLRKGMAGAREHSPEDFITKITSVTPGQKGQKIWQDCLDLIFQHNQELIDYVQMICGLAAIGKVYVEALIIAYGDGRNGKSTFWNAVSRVLGLYSDNISADTLTVGCKRNVKPELAEAKGKRMIIAAELEEGMRLNTSNVKQLCSTDEIYAELTYGKKHVSIAALPDMYERCVVLNGFSKAFAMTGWRMGIAAGPAEVIFHMNKIHQFTTMSAGTTSQVAALEALTSPVRDEEIDVMRKEYDERRKIMVDGFRNMGLDVTEPEGAFYVFPSIKKTGLTSMEFCNRLLQEQKVAVIPGDAFGSCAEGYIRCSYAYSKDIIKKCLEKIAVFVSQFDLK